MLDKEYAVNVLTALVDASEVAKENEVETLGFLVYNFHPAKIFMGDTGSLFLGGMVVVLAYMINNPLILIPAGMVYIFESLSDIIQVLYFKISGGKRFFKMAPIHHHFEKCGWSENKIVLVFSLTALAFCVLAYFGIGI